mmetsp:Transcript_22622/g.52697  ORF Transcript_22622/g.52697 Transcript_22622/m.52697 type:complete len:615 (+) Transcript_22622:67-1911(+)
MPPPLPLCACVSARRRTRLAPKAASQNTQSNHHQTSAHPKFSTGICLLRPYPARRALSRSLFDLTEDLAHGDPDVFALDSLDKELLALALLVVHPVARNAVVAPGALDVEGRGVLDKLRASDSAVVPHGLDVLVLRQVLGQVLAVAGYNVDDAAGQVGGVEHLVQVNGRQGVLLAGHNDHGVAANKCRGNERDKRQERVLVGAHDGHGADGLVDLDGCAVEGSLLHGAAELVAVGAPVEQPPDGAVDLGEGLVRGAPRHGGDAPSELVTAQLQVLGEVVHNLGAVVRGALAPASESSVRGLDSVPDVLAVALTNVGNRRAVGPLDLADIDGVGPLLHSTDVHLGCAVNGRHGSAVEGGDVDHGRGLARARVDRPLGNIGTKVLGRLLAGECGACALLPLRAAVGVQALLASVTPETGLAESTEAGGGIEEVVGVDPHGPRLDAQAHLHGQTNVLGPHRPTETVDAVVGQGNRLLGSAERLHRQNGAEDLLHDAGGRGVAAEHERRREVQANVRHARARLEHLVALSLGDVNVALQRLELALVHDRTHVDVLVQAVAKTKSAHARLELLDEDVVDLLLHQQARTGAAHLALVEPDRVDNALHSAVNVSAVEHDDG